MSKKPGTRPVAIAGYVIIFLTFGVMGGWASMAKLDSAVSAPGTISLEGNRKVVQHLEGGIVSEILVKEADIVEQGDVLLRLSDVESRSNRHAIDTRINVARVIEARLLAERSLAESLEIPTDLQNSDISKEVKSAIADQRDFFEGRRSILKSRTSILNTRIDQTKSQIKGLELQRSALERRLANYQELLDRMRSGEERGFIQSNLLSEREDDLIQIESQLGSMISEIARTQIVISETEYEIIRLEQEYQERANSDLENVRAEIVEQTQRLKITKDVMSRTEIRSPGSGTIQNLQVHTVDSVIGAGEVLMELVPQNEELIINARVSPRDIDNVSPGLKTEVRFTAFNSKLTPIMLGSVQTVSNDVITPENPQEMPYYLARIEVSEEDIPKEIQGRVSAGMPADVIITSGERTVVNYITSPIMDAVRKSMIEE